MKRCAGRLAARRSAERRDGDGRCHVRHFSSGGGLGIHQPRSADSRLATKRVERQGRARDRVKCPAVAGNHSRGGVEGHAFERPYWLTRVRAMPGVPVATGEGEGVADVTAKPDGRRKARQDAQAATSHMAGAIIVTRPRRSELGAGIKPGPREAFTMRGVA